MKTGVKVITGLFAVFVFAVAGLSLFVRFYLTEKRLTEMLIPSAEKALGRKVEIGSIGVSLFKGITVRNLSIKETDGSQEFFKSGAFILRYDLMPLLQKNLVVSEVLLENPSITVLRDKKGHFNFETLAVLQEKTERTHDKEPASATGALPLALTVDTIKISGARFLFKDAKGELPAVDAGADVTIGLEVGRTLNELRYHGNGKYTVDVDYSGLRPKVSGKIDFDENMLSFDNDVEVQGEKIRLTGVVQNYAKVPAIQLNVQSKKLDLDKILALAASLGGGQDSKKATDPSRKTKQKAIGEALPAGLTARGMVEVDRALIRSLAVDNFTLSYALDKNILTVRDLTASSAGGQISSEMTLDLNEPDLAYSGNVGVRSVQLPQLQSVFFPKIPESISGGLSTNFSYSGVGTNWQQMKDRLSAQGDFSLLNGALTNSAVARSISQLTGLTELENLVFDGFTGNFRLTEGKILLKSSIDARDFDMESQGAIGLDSTLDLPVTLTLSPELSARAQQKSSLTRFLADEQGRTTLKLKVAGTMKKPLPTLDSAAVQKQMKETVKEKALSEIEKALGAKQAPADATSPDKTKPTLEEAGKGLIKGLFGN